MGFCRHAGRLYYMQQSGSAWTNQSLKVLAGICASGHPACPVECSARAGGVQTRRVARHSSKLLL